MSSPTKTKKKRKPKGKSLSETLRAKDERKAAEAAAIDSGPEQTMGSPDGADEHDSVDSDSAEQQNATDRDVDSTPSSEESQDEAAQGDDERDENVEPVSETERPAGSGDGATVEEGPEREHFAAAMGYQRYVILGFLALWIVASYVLGRALAGAWSELANNAKFVQWAPTIAGIAPEGELISRASISMVLGAIVGGAIVLYYYYRRKDVRQWADEVAEEISKVEWPTRKQIGSDTVIVITASALLTLYLTLLDRFWAFVTNLIYSTGA